MTMLAVVNRCTEAGWTKIGADDREGRRSLWMRLTGFAGNRTTLPDFVSIELCAGREGDDCYVKLRSGDRVDNAILESLCDVLDTYYRRDMHYETLEEIGFMPPEKGGTGPL